MNKGSTRRVALYVCALLVAAALCTLVSRHIGPARIGAQPGVVIALAALLVMSETFTVRFRHGEEINALNLFDAMLAPLLLAGPAFSMIAVVGLAQAAAAVLRRNSMVKSAFNVSQWMLAAAAGRLVLDAWRVTTPVGREGVLPLVLAMLVAGMVNQTAFTGVIAIVERSSPMTVLAGFRPVIWSGWVGGWVVNTAFGVVFTLSAAESAWVIPLFAVPLVVLHSAYRGRAQAHAERARARGMHQASRSLATPLDPRDSIPLFLEDILRLYAAAAVDLVLLDEHEHLFTRVTAAGEVMHGPLRRRPTLGAELLQLREPVRLGTGADAQLDALLNLDGWRDGIAAPLLSGADVIGVLCVYDRSGLEGTDDVDLSGLEMLAREAAAALAKARLVRAIDDERDKLSQIVTHASDGIFTVERDGTIASWNPELERITGFTAGEMVGRRGLARLAARDEAGAGVDFEGWARDVDALPAGIQVASRTGRVRRLSCSYSPVLGSDGDGMLVVVARDETEAHEMARLQEDYRRLTELEEAQREIVGQLQEAVRPLMPIVPGTELGVHYLPADEIAPTGGDLYDWQLLPNGDLHLAVVDVLGKGVSATKDAMTVTSALRLLALSECPLEDLILRADALVTAQSSDLVATTIVVRYRPQTGQLWLAGAGHPPALVVRANGEVRELEAPGIALGWPGASSFEITEHLLERDDTLILYTDGLVEATKDIIAGLEALSNVAAAAADYPAGKLARVLVERSLSGAQRRDDSVALILRRRNGLTPGADPCREVFEHRLAPCAERVSIARRELGRWLDVVDPDATLRDDLILVASELVTNAVRAARSEVVVRARIETDGVMLEVEDDGGGGLRWPTQGAHATAEGGRGLLIVEELSEDVAVYTDDTGTVVRCARRAARQATPASRLVRVVAERLAERPSEHPGHPEELAS